MVYRISNRPKKLPTLALRACGAALAVVCAGLAAACSQNVAAQLQAPADHGSAVVSAVSPGSSEKPAAPPPPVAPPAPVSLDAQQPKLEMVALSIYNLVMPAGTVRDSEAFWKKIDEQVVDIPTADLLYKNGVRVGEGRVSDWAYFKDIMDAGGVNAHHVTFYAHTLQEQMLLASPNLADQLLFYFDRHGLTGQRYENCQDIFDLAFEPAPRKENTVRLQLCPLVRATQHHYSYTVQNNEEEVAFVRDEHLYDLNLRVDLPAGQFLVVAPSADAAHESSIGHNFLTIEGPANRYEQVLILVANSAPELPSAHPHKKHGPVVALPPAPSFNLPTGPSLPRGPRATLMPGTPDTGVQPQGVAAPPQGQGGGVPSF